MSKFTPTQGRYLAFIRTYTRLHGHPPVETEIAAAMRVTPPSVNLMVKTLEKKGLILRQPGQPRSLQVLVPEDEIQPSRSPRRQQSGSAADQRSEPAAAVSNGAAANLYVVTVFLVDGPVPRKFAGKEISRVIEIRGDQTLADLHNAIFKAYDRWEEHLYEFQFGKRPFDPEGPKFGISLSGRPTRGTGDARTTTLDELHLTPERVFGYWFDFGDDWFHQIQVDRIEQAIPTVTYPRVTRRVGKSPPQYAER